MDFEYKIEVILYRTFGGRKISDHIVQKMGDFSVDGWEVIGILDGVLTTTGVATNAKSPSLTCFLKRKLQKTRRTATKKTA